MIASVASVPPSQPLNGTPAADRPMTLTDEEMTVATTEPAGTERLVLDSAGKHHRKRRRGKRRRPGRDEPDAALSSSDGASPVKRSPPKLRKNQVVIRPREVPKAPANFTQFIIDDHENCELYQSFEVAHPNENVVERSNNYNGGYVVAADDVRLSSASRCHYHRGPHSDDSGDEGHSWSPATEDYECLDYGHMMEFYEKDFEVVYKSARFEELMGLKRSELIEGYTMLECRVAQLCDELQKLDPQNCLDELQRQLLRLQEENEALHKLNLTLRSAAVSSLTTTTSSSSSQDDEYVDDSDERDCGAVDGERADSCGDEEESGDSGNEGEDSFEDTEGVEEDHSRP